MRWGRIVVGVLVAEVAAALLLVVLVFLTGPADAEEAEKSAEALGRWVGPVGGSLATFCAAWWAAQGSVRLVASGVAVGAIAAALDLALLLALSDRFDGLFVLSNALRLLAGFLGGQFAAFRAAPRSSPAA